MKDNTKTLEAVQVSSVRTLVSFVNENHIQKEAIVQVLPDENGFFLLYYN